MIPVRPLPHEPPLHLPKLPPGQAYRFHVMVKPAGAQCNLDCSYCFYLHKEDLLGQPKMPRMSEGLLEAHIRQYIEAQTGEEIVFSWQGGEPTLMGIGFFEKVVEYQQKYRRDGQRIENDLQTNGLLLDEQWADFLREHRFLVGLSIDGPADLHDRHRYSKGQQPTHARVMVTVELLHRSGVPFSALCVVNRDNARRPIDVYRFLRDQVRPRQIQFLPCVESAVFHGTAPGHWPADMQVALGSPRAQPGQPGSVVTDWSIGADQWGYFLTRVWDEWFARDYGRVFVDQFEDVVSMVLGFGSQKCVTSPICGKALAIEHDGDLYACDRFVYPEYRLGNIRRTHEGDLAFSAAQEAFGYAKAKTLPNYCRSCEYLQLCWGNCPKDRFLKTPDGEPGLQYLCSGLKQFYRKVLADRSELVRRHASRSLR